MRPFKIRSICIFKYPVKSSKLRDHNSFIKGTGFPINCLKPVNRPVLSSQLKSKALSLINWPDMRSEVVIPAYQNVM